MYLVDFNFVSLEKPDQHRALCLQQTLAFKGIWVEKFK